MLGCISIHWVDDIGCTQLHRQCTLFGHRVSRNDTARTGNFRRVNRCKTNAATADNCNGFTGRYFACVENGACTCGDSAANDRCLIKRHFGVNRNARMFMHQHHFGISRQVQHLVDDAAIGACQARGFAGLAPGIAAKAQGHPARDAIFAMAAECAQAGDNGVADLNGAHFAAHGLNNTRRLMTRNRGQGMRICAFDEMQIAMAKPAGRSADKHLMRPGVRNIDLFNLKRFARFDQDGRFHRATPMSPLDMPSLPRPPCLPNSIRAMARACTSSGPSARRKVR